MKTAITIITLAIALTAAILGFIWWIGKHKENEHSLIGEAYESVFWLIGYLRSQKPETFKKVSKRLDGVIDTLLEVEKILQEDEQ